MPWLWMVRAVVALACVVYRGNSACSNLSPTAVCNAKAAVWECYLDDFLPIFCKLACGAGLDCPGTIGDFDPLCFYYSNQCDDPVYNAGLCNGTCQRRSSIVCDPLLVVPNASPSNPSPLYGDKVTYTCDLDFNQTGGETGFRACATGGAWFVSTTTGLPPVCEGVRCPSPPEIPGCEPSANSSSYPDVITYSCVLGSIKQSGGTARHSCNASGAWIADSADTIPVCVSVSCPSPPEIPGCEPSANSSSYPDVITYSCALGSIKQSGGTARHSCNASGAWIADSADTIPVCVSVSCPSPPEIPGCEPSANSSSYPDVITYSCVLGSIKLSGGTARHSCNASGAWIADSADTIPVCVSVSCPSPPEIPGCEPSANSSSYPDVITYSCVLGSIKQSGGTARHSCNASGAWIADSADTIPVCVSVSCTSPPEIPGCEPSANSSSYPDVITYSCVPGSIKLYGGTARHSCNASGAWIADSADTIPVCVSETNHYHTSVSEIDAGATPMLTNRSARSNLECARFCSLSPQCEGYTYSKTTHVCTHNVGPYMPIVTEMKKVYKQP